MVLAQGFLGTKRTLYRLCLVKSDLAHKFDDPLFKAALDTSKHTKWILVPSLTEQDGTTIHHLVSNIVQAAPKTQWDSLIERELHTRFNVTPIKNTGA